MRYWELVILSHMTWLACVFMVYSMQRQAQMTTLNKNNSSESRNDHAIILSIQSNFYHRLCMTLLVSSHPLPAISSESTQTRACAICGWFMQVINKWTKGYSDRRRRTSSFTKRAVCFSYKRLQAPILKLPVKPVEFSEAFKDNPRENCFERQGHTLPTRLMLLRRGGA